MSLASWNHRIAEEVGVNSGKRTMKTMDINSLCVLGACPELVEGPSAVKRPPRR
jgi:hypothetical protein